MKIDTKIQAEGREESHSSQGSMDNKQTIFVIDDVKAINKDDNSNTNDNKGKTPYKQLRIVTHKTGTILDEDGEEEEEKVDKNSVSSVDSDMDVMQQHKQATLTLSVDPDKISRKVKRTQLLFQ